MQLRKEGEWKGFGGCIHSGEELSNPFCANSCPSCCRHFQPTSAVNHQTSLEREEKMLHKEAVLKLLDNQLHIKEARLREMEKDLEQQRRELCKDEDRLNLKENELFAYEDSLDYYHRYMFDNTPTFSQHSPSYRSAPSYGGRSHSNDHNSNRSVRRSRSNSRNSPQLVGRLRSDSHNSIRPIISVTPPESSMYQPPNDRRQYDGDYAPRGKVLQHSQSDRRTPEHQTYL
ncbi:hypothetical protein OCU04_010866 [Sclerotinia nivalis]|uniref:Uncharacterized protein n=1 Tax=Sclerotinia nivalis TaxID=352851 RepID=A0A9X0AD39_9HELO|nr:hypothetical protein OCU04_010866 [Sclerotinia nivalis]